MGRRWGGGNPAAPPSLRGFAGREKGKITPCRENKRLKREIKGGEREPARGWGRTLRWCLEIGEISVSPPPPHSPNSGLAYKRRGGRFGIPRRNHRSPRFELCFGGGSGGGCICSAVISAVAGGRWNSGERFEPAFSPKSSGNEPGLRNSSPIPLPQIF